MKFKNRPKSNKKKAVKSHYGPGYNPFEVKEPETKYRVPPNDEKQNILKLYNEKLKALNPLNMMDKGFSLVTSNDKIIRETKDVKVGDSLNIRLKKGSILAKVEGIKDGK